MTMRAREAFARCAAPMAAVLLTALAGCAGAPARPSDAAQRAARLQAALTDAERLIEAAGPSSLARAAEVLAAEDVKSTPAGTGLSTFGSRLFAGLYPDLDNPFAAAPAGPLAANAPDSKFFREVSPALILLGPGSGPDDQAASDMLAGLTAADETNRGSVLPPYLRAVLLQRQDRPAQTIRPLYEECLRRDPSFYPAKAGIIQAAIDEGKAAADQQALVKLAAELPAPAAVQSWTAKILLAAGRPREAADTAAQALLKSPESTDLLLLRAKAFDAMGDWYQALSILDSLLRISPDNRAAVAMKATLLFEEAGNPDGAMQLLSEAETRFPEDPAFPELHGRILLSRGNSAEGEEELAAALRLDPTRVSALSLLASSAAAGQRWQEAASYLERIPAGRRDAGLLTLGWQVAMKLADYDRALAIAHDLERSQTVDSRLLFSVRTLLAAGRLPETRDLATADLKTVQAPQVRASLYVLRALAARQGGGDAQAVLTDLRTAIRENPDDREALLAIADALGDAHEYRKALAYLKHAQDLAPDDPSLRARVSDMSRLAASED